MRFLFNNSMYFIYICSSKLNCDSESSNIIMFMSNLAVSRCICRAQERPQITFSNDFVFYHARNLSLKKHFDTIKKNCTRFVPVFLLCNPIGVMVVYLVLKP